MYSLKLDKREMNSDTVGEEPAVFFIGGNMYGSYQSGTVTIENL